MSDNQIRGAFVLVSAVASGGVTYMFSNSVGLSVLAAILAGVIAAVTCGLAVALFDWMDL